VIDSKNSLAQHQAQRLRQLSDLMKLLQEKLVVFERARIISGDAATVFNATTVIRDEIRPDLHKYMVEYLAILSSGYDEIYESQGAEALANELSVVMADTENLIARSRNIELSQSVRGAIEEFRKPSLPTASRLKVAIPIIPMLLSYEVDIDTSNLVVRAWSAIVRFVDKEVLARPI